MLPSLITASKQKRTGHYWHLPPWSHWWDPRPDTKERLKPSNTRAGKQRWQPRGAFVSGKQRGLSQWDFHWPLTVDTAMAFLNRAFNDLSKWSFQWLLPVGTPMAYLNRPSTCLTQVRPSMDSLCRASNGLPEQMQPKESLLWNKHSTQKAGSGRLHFNYVQTAPLSESRVATDTTQNC